MKNKMLSLGLEVKGDDNEYNINELYDFINKDYKLRHIKNTERIECKNNYEKPQKNDLSTGEINGLLIAILGTPVVSEIIKALMEILKSYLLSQSDKSTTIILKAKKKKQFEIIIKNVDDPEKINAIIKSLS